MKILTAICGATLVLAGAIFAQSPADRVTVHFNTPVAVGGTILPAGDCDIRVLRGSSDNVTLILRAQSGAYTSVVASRLSEPGSTDDSHASVVLDRRGDGYRLNRILFSDHTGYQLNTVE